MKRKSKIWLGGFLFVVLAAGVTAAYFLTIGKPAEPPPRTTKVRRGELKETAALSGTVQANIQVEVKSRASGEVSEVAVVVGAVVKQGDLLIKLDPVDEQRNVKQADVNLKSANSRLAEAKANLAITERQARLADEKLASRIKARATGAVTEEDLNMARADAEVAAATITLRKAQVDSADTQVTIAQLALDESNLRLAQTTITAPVGGTVLAINIQKGAIVASGISNVGGGTSLMTLGDLSIVHVLGALDEADVGRVTRDLEVEVRVDAYPDRKFDGRVALVSPLGKMVSNVVTFDLDVIVTDKDAHLLLPGMSADLQVVTSRTRGALLIPASAVRVEEREHVVTMAGGERRVVKLGNGDGASYVVVEGLNEGDEIVANAGRTTSSSSGPRFSLFGGGGRR
ncbi:MAG: efflux RND transporter periplasmic adaptor subunit [Planctomycetes bacterium]|nr:efflux RND transporter periplasmic adaptor subunit [Planctomycetota bacterium]